MNENCGIYSITNTLNGHAYIGSAVNISKRWSKHISDLKNNGHHSGHLQNAWNKYGVDCFEFSILEQCKKEQLIEREQFYIDSEHPEYNIAPTAGSSLGREFSVETRALISAAMKGKTNALGSKHTEDELVKMRAAGMGNTHALGYKHTEAARLQISEAHKGMHSSIEARLKISAANKRRWAKRR